MGFFDFIKDAGEKLTGRDEPEAAAPVQGLPTPSIEEMRRQQDQARSKALVLELSRLKLGVDGLNVLVSGSTAIVKGEAPNQETKEKVVLAIGNTAGVGRVDDQMTVGEQEPEAQFHTVESGESLSLIAKQYYGNAMKYPVIFEANKPMLSDPDKIYPGQVLRIPALD